MKGEKETQADIRNTVAQPIGIPFELNDDEKALVVNDYPDYYITSHGRLYSNKQHRFIGHENKKTHYIQATLLTPKNADNHNKYKAYVHELVLEHFNSPKPSDEYECDHIDGDTTNNNINNLQWLIHRDNLLKRRPYTKDRKQRLTKDSMNTFNKWYLDNKERLCVLSCEKIAKLFKEENNIDINLQTVRINRNKWVFDENNNLKRI